MINVGVERLHRLVVKFDNSWKHSSKKAKIFIYIGIYTVIFIFVAFFAYRPFWSTNRTFVINGDGVDQHYPLMVYVGHSLRRIIQNIFHGDFEIPFFDISSGLGDDIIGLLNSLGRTDPLLLFSVFIPVHYSEYFYCFIAVFRVFLAGLSFSYLCRHFQKSMAHTLIGSMVYCFGAYGFSVSIRHPYFANPMIILPILIVGIEKILQKEKQYTFILAVIYMVLCGFYHLYMMTIMVGIYAFMRFIDLYKENRIKEFISVAGRGISAYCLGIGLSATILFPSIFEFLNGDRAGYSHYQPTNYTFGYFRNRFLRMFSPAPGTGWSYPSFAAIALLALILLYFSKRRHLVKFLTSIAFAFYWFSFGGLIMNGFQYSSARWTFGLTLIVAFVVVEMLPILLQLTFQNKLVLFLTLLIYAGLAFYTSGTRKLTFVTIGVVFVTATVMVLTMSINSNQEEKQYVDFNKRQRRILDVRYREIACLAVVVVNVCINGLYKASADQGNLIADYTKFGTITERLEQSVERELEPFLSDNPAGRADSSSFNRNWASVWKIPGMLVYSSIANGNITEFWQEIELSGSNNPFNMWSTGQRTIMGTILSQKYHVESEENVAYVPFGYTLIENTNNGNLIFENKYALPWGYTYDTIISYDDLIGLNGIQKQEAMLQAIALENVDSSVDLQYDEYTLPYRIKYNGCEWEDGNLTISETNATITLSFKMPADVEGYVRLNKFDLNGSGVNAFGFYVNCESVSKKSMAASDLYTYYAGRENYLFNLGYSEKERTELIITFPTKGTYKLDNIELYALPMDKYSTRVEALRAEPLENIEWSTNRLTGTVNLSKDKVLCVSVPYSKGWSAKVDGKKVELLRGNYMFMALPLGAGYHNIEFTYCSPGLKVGAILTIICFVIVVYMFIRDLKKTKQRKNENETI